jgi:ApbE superfamily uncharacterized protein (UPF0280 family)
MQTPEKRTYRSLVAGSDRLKSFRVVVKETDLLIRAQRPLVQEATDLILKHRLPLERYVRDHPDFIRSLTPLGPDKFAPPIAQTMIRAGQKTGVGPMAAVAGALAEEVGKDLLALSPEVIVENGGDVFIRSDSPLTVAIFAGSSPLTNKVGLRIHAPDGPIAVCTSSGTVGHSLSLGKADAVVVISRSTPLADAAATSIGNAVGGKGDVASGITKGKNFEGVLGVVVIVEDELGPASRRKPQNEAKGRPPSTWALFAKKSLLRKRNK